MAKAWTNIFNTRISVKANWPTSVEATKPILIKNLVLGPKGGVGNHPRKDMPTSVIVAKAKKQKSGVYDHKRSVETFYSPTSVKLDSPTEVIATLNKTTKSRVSGYICLLASATINMLARSVTSQNICADKARKGRRCTNHFICVSSAFSFEDTLLQKELERALTTSRQRPEQLSRTGFDKELLFRAWRRGYELI